MQSILVTGANGQIGSELVDVLRERHGPDNVVGVDLEPPASAANGRPRGPHETADVRNRERLREIMDAYDVGTVYHLASLLSAIGEKHPDRAWTVNLGGLKNVLDLARRRDQNVFWPSSIAVFGPGTPDRAPQRTVLDPTTMYGVTKRSGELLCRYYHRRYDVDVRSLRYPGLISHKTMPGGGTTDYAVDMYFAAARGEDYTCYLRPDTRLPMMYMPDAVRGTLALMDADPSSLTVREGYNLGSMSFSAADLAETIAERVPDFSCSFEPDDRQAIADAWPAAVDDSQARTDWDWAPEYDLDAMTEDMLYHLRQGEPA